jgi:Domain of unknown function (DUF4123)
MKTAQSWKDSWANVCSTEAGQTLFALIDPAQDPLLLNSLIKAGHPSACLFGYEIDSPIAKSTPRLVQLGGVTSSTFLDDLFERVPTRACGTLLSSNDDFPAVLQHLSVVADVNLDGIDSMFLAFWDPAILGTLVGQPDDSTLHVAGPVLTAEQKLAFFGPVRNWWYWDRSGDLHAIRSEASSATEVASHSPSPLPLILDSEQVDLLVEASVPDHLLSHIAANQPELLANAPKIIRYEFVRQQLNRARMHGLIGMSDLVNYVCIAFLYGPTFDEAANMPQLLFDVKNAAITFDEAISKVDEPSLVKSSTPVALLPTTT